MTEPFDRPHGDTNRSQRRRHNVIGVAAVAILIVLAFAEVVFGGKTLSSYPTVVGAEGLTPIAAAAEAPLDTFRPDRGASSWAFEPWGEVNDRILEQGDLPLWNPYQGIGAPQAGNMQSGALDPLLLPANIFSSLLIRDVMMLATFIAGAVAMFGFGRILGLKAFESFVAAGASGLTGWFLLYSNNNFSRAYVFLPVLFLLVELMVREFRPWHVLALGVATAGSITIGMPEASFVVLVMSGVYAVVRSVQTRAENSWRPLVRLSAGFALGLALAAPLLALFLEYLGQSFSLHEAGSSIGLAVDPPRLILNLFVPFHAGEPFDAVGNWTGTRGWLAAGTTMLALIGLSGRRLTRRFNAMVFAGFALVIVFRVYAVGVLDWTGRLPILERVNYPTFALAALPFVVAILAGIGVAVLRAGDLDPRRFSLLAGLAAVEIIVLVVAFRDRSVIEGTIASDAPRQFGLALLVAVTIGVAAITATRWRPAAVVAGLLALVELMLLAPRGIYPDRIDPYPITPSVAAVQRLTADDPLARIYAFDAELFPNTASAYGLYDIRMLDALYVDRYFRYLKEYIQPTVFDRFVGGPWASLEEPFTRYADNPMIDMLGVRHFIANVALPTTDLMLKVAQASPTDVRFLDIPEDPRTSLFLHPPASFELPPPPDDATGLALAIGMDNEAFKDSLNDGVRFTVTATQAGGGEVVLFSETYVPRVDPATPEWRDRQISLPQGPERVVGLFLNTDPIGNTSTDWAGWADLTYLDEQGVIDPLPLTLAAVTENSLVFANPNALPRAWVANTVHGVKDMAGAIAFFDQRRGNDDTVDFSPRQEVVIEGVQSTTPGTECDGPTDVVISEYDSNLVEMTATTPCSGFLILADAWYPGWHAEVDGQEQEIYPANVALRGVAVPAGTSVVRFGYDPSSFRFGLLIAIIGLGTFAAWAITLSLRKRSAAPRGPIAAGESAAPPNVADDETRQT